MVKKGDDCGWPYVHWDHLQNKKILNPEYGGDGKLTGAEKAIAPLVGFPGHMAPNALLMYTGNQFPAKYKNGAFIAFHGSTNRGPYPQAGYIVAFIPFEGEGLGKSVDKWEVFADGFAGVETIANMSDAKYRPMGLSEGPDGSLYVSESKKGKIWRIVFTGDLKTFSEAQLVQMEQRKSRMYLKLPDEKADLVSVKVIE